MGLAYRIKHEVMSPVRTLDNYLMRTRLDNNEAPFLISQNCVGACLYHALGMRFDSPFINGIINGADLLSFLKRPAYYLDIEASESGQVSAYGSDHCSVVGIGDIRFYALHDEDPVSAAKAWNRRRTRVNLDRCFVIATSWNCENDLELINRITECGFPTVVFSDIDVNNDSVVKLNREHFRRDARGIVRPNLTDYSCNGIRYMNRMFDFCKWINSNGSIPACECVKRTHLVNETA